MARIRSIHPGFFTDEECVSVSAFARLLFVGIWTEADDQGAFEWKPTTLKMRILIDNIDVSELLGNSRANLIKQYEMMENGTGYSELHRPSPQKADIEVLRP